MGRKGRRVQLYSGDVGDLGTIQVKEHSLSEPGSGEDTRRDKGEDNKDG
jgi:hypothetical protein